jgi:hypothetical protein
LPNTDSEAQFLQVYFLGTIEEQAATRNRPDLDAEIISSLSSWLDKNNFYVHTLKTATQIISEEHVHEHKIVIRAHRCPSGEHERRYNAPTSQDVAVLMKNEPTANRDIVIRFKSGALQRISELHPAYDSLQYPQLFPFGSDGYHIQLTGTNGKKNTQQQFYKYNIMRQNCPARVQTNRFDVNADHPDICWVHPAFRTFNTMGPYQALPTTDLVWCHAAAISQTRKDGDIHCKYRKYGHPSVDS